MVGIKVQYTGTINAFHGVTGRIVALDAAAGTYRVLLDCGDVLDGVRPYNLTALSGIGY